MKQIRLSFRKNTWILFFLLFLMSCFFKEEQLIGEYYLNNGLKNDLIIIKKDSTYLHRFTSFGGRVYESSGTWNFNRKYWDISFDGFIFYDQEGSTNLPDMTGFQVSV